MSNPVNMCNNFEYIFSCGISDGAEILSQTRLRFCSLNMLTRMCIKCSRNVHIALLRNFCATFYSAYFCTQHKKLHFLNFESHLTTCIVKCLKPRNSANKMFMLNNIYNFEALMRNSIFAFTVRLTNSKNAIICII